MGVEQSVLVSEVSSAASNDHVQIRYGKVRECVGQRCSKGWMQFISRFTLVIMAKVHLCGLRYFQLIFVWI